MKKLYILFSTEEKCLSAWLIIHKKARRKFEVQKNFHEYMHYITQGFRFETEFQVSQVSLINNSKSSQMLLPSWQSISPDGPRNTWCACHFSTILVNTAIWSEFDVEAFKMELYLLWTYCASESWGLGGSGGPVGIGVPCPNTECHFCTMPSINTSYLIFFYLLSLFKLTLFWGKIIQ